MSTIGNGPQQEMKRTGPQREMKHIVIINALSMVEKEINKLEALGSSIKEFGLNKPIPEDGSKEAMPSLSQFLDSGASRILILAERIAKAMQEIRENLF